MNSSDAEEEDNAEPIREKDKKLATKEEIEELRKQLQRKPT